MFGGKKNKCFNETVVGETQEITTNLNIENLTANSTREKKSWITVIVLGRNFYYNCATSKITKF